MGLSRIRLRHFSLENGSGCHTGWQNDIFGICAFVCLRTTFAFILLPLAAHIGIEPDRQRDGPRVAAIGEESRFSVIDRILHALSQNLERFRHVTASNGRADAMVFAAAKPEVSLALLGNVETGCEMLGIRHAGG